MRDLRIDLLRGLALVMIFINHIPGTIWENFTSRNFGFSDAAEGFVLMSGIATGLAYGPAFQAGRPTLATALRPWKRAFTLWWVHVLIVACILAMFFLALGYPSVQAMAEKRNILPALAHLNDLALPLLLLTHQFAYADILPLYIVMMLVAPLLLTLAVRWPRTLMAASLLVWFLVGLFRIKMPTWPTDYGWFFNPLAWQVLFVAGMLTGLALRKGERLLPESRWALRIATAFLAVSALWVLVPSVAAYGGHGLWLLHEYAYLPHVFTSFDKSFLFLPRLLHILALAYVLSLLPWFRTLAATPRLAPLVLLGRHSLPVFACSTVLAYLIQIMKVVLPPSVVLDTGAIAIGLAILFVVAAQREGAKRATSRLSVTASAGSDIR